MGIISTAQVLVVLPGATANAERLEALRENALESWPEARVEVPDYLSRWRGVRGVGNWLDRWAAASLYPHDEVFLFAFILGAAALPYAPALLGHVRRLVVLRSRYQEGVPRFLRRRFTPPLAALLFGRAVADLGQPPFWPVGFAAAVPALTLVETRPTRLAEHLKIRPLSDAELGIDGAVEVGLDHDFAYFAPSLMKTAVDWLRSG